MGFRIVKPEMIRKARGNRSLEDIAKASGGKFTKGALWQWEQNGYNVLPSPDNVPALLAALGCEYEQISEPVEAVAA